MGDDVAREAVVVGTLAERHLRRDGPGEVLFRDAVQPGVDVLPERLAGVDLMTGDTDVHLQLPSGFGAGLRPAPRMPSTAAVETIRLLSVGDANIGLPLAVTAVWVTRARVQRHMRVVVVAYGALCLIVLGGQGARSARQGQPGR